MALTLAQIELLALGQRGNTMAMTLAYHTDPNGPSDLPLDLRRDILLLNSDQISHLLFILDGERWILKADGPAAIYDAMPIVLADRDHRPCEPNAAYLDLEAKYLG